MSLRFSAAVVCLSTLLLVSACGGSLSNARKIDYRNAPTLPPLEVPPDLSTLPDSNPARAGQSNAPGTATYSGYAGGQQRKPPTGNDAVLPQYPDVKLGREGPMRYVIVNAEPRIVWGEVRDFLGRNGLSVASEDPKAGLMETGWAENRALVGAKEGNVLSKLLKSFYSTGTRDKYRLRLERGATPGTTEIFLSHQGMEEVAPDESGAAREGWKPRPADPELEAEMIHRLAVYLGEQRIGEKPGAQAQASTPAAGSPPAASTSATASTPASASAPSAPAAAADASASANAPAQDAASAPSARLIHNGDGAPLLTLQDSLDRAWRRVGLSLDRIGFTVEDRDRSKGIYYVRYIDPDTAGKKKGFFSRLFTGGEPAPRNQYQVHIKPADNGTNVEVLDKEGDPDASKIGERILSLLYEQLK